MEYIYTVLKYILTRRNKKVAINDLKQLLLAKKYNYPYIPTTILHNNFLQFKLSYKDGLANLFIPIGLRYKNMNDIVMYITEYNEDIGTKDLFSKTYIKISVYKSYYKSEIISTNNSYNKEFLNFISYLNFKQNLNVNPSFSKDLDSIFKYIMYYNFCNVSDITSILRARDSIQNHINKFKYVV